MSDPVLATPAPERGHRLAQARAQAAATWARTTELRQQAEQLLADTQALQQITTDARRERRSSPAGRKQMRQSAYARLLARLETMPVIEQAKGIIMAQSRCGEAEAFGMLRQASQRSNIPVRDLAARIVATAASTAPPGTTPAPGPDTQHRTARHAGTRPVRIA